MAQSAAEPALFSETLLTPGNASEKTKHSVKTSTFNYVQSTLRLTRLHILPEVFGRGMPHEERKVAIHRDWWMALLHASTLVIPLGIAVALVIINARQVFLGDVHSKTLTATQFAAKFFELLMQASVATIVLSIIRAQVMRDEALPLGGLVAPYHTNNVSYLWSLEFWGCLTASDIAIRRRIWLATTITLLLLLTALLGPSAAVLMIPRPTISHLYNDLFILDPASSTFPANIQTRDNITSTYDEIVAQTVGLHPPTSFNVVNMLGTRTLNVGQKGQKYLESDTTTATVPARMTQFVPWYLEFSNYDPTKWVVYDSLQPNVSVTCQEYGADVMQDPSVTHLSFENWDGQLLNHAMLKSDLFPNATNTTGVDSASSLIIELEPVHMYVTQVWRDLPEKSSNFSSLMAFGWWDRDAANRTTSRGVTTCAIVAEWIPVQANYSWIEQSLTYQPARGRSSHANNDERRAIRLSSAWLQRLTENYVKYSQSGAIGLWVSPGSAVIIALALADYGPVPEQDGSSTYQIIPSGRYCRCLGTECSSVFDDPNGALPVNQCDALRAHLNTNGMFKEYGSVLLHSTTNWTDPTTLQYLIVKRYGSGYGYGTATIPVQLSLCILMAYILAVLSYLSYSLLTGQSATSWDSFAELLMLALNSHRPQQLEATSVGVDTLASFKELVNIRINEENTAEIVFKNDLDVDRARYRKAVVNAKY